MPEGDTLFKIAGFIRQRAEGRRVVGAALLGRPAPSLAHRRVLAVDVHGKHLCVDLGPPGAGGFRLRVHLGMFGSWHHYPAKAPWQRPRRQASVVLEVEGAGTFVCFLAADVGLATGAAPAADGPARIRGLGEQLLVDEGAPPGRTPDARAIARAVAALPDDTPMCDVLLNQRAAAGFGNVYKSELLFLFGWPPSLAKGALAPWQLESVFALGQKLLRQNVGGWPRTTTVDRRRMPMMGGLPRLWIYNRTGQGCLLCGTAVLRAAMGRHRRSTFWCPTCQPAAGPAASAPEACRLVTFAHVPLARRRRAGALRGR